MMTEAGIDREKAARRRSQAEETVRLKAAEEAADPNRIWPEAARQALHELRVHQIELELQNEELRCTQEELEITRTRYVDLYDLAPVGYITLGDDGRIIEANLTATSLLALARSEMVEQSLTNFIVAADQDIYYHHRRRLLETGAPQTCELRLSRPDGSVFWARLQATSQRDRDGQSTCRTTLSDISERRKAEEIIEASESRHRVMFETSHDALMTLAPPGWGFTSGNSSALTMFGARDQADFVSRKLWQYSPEHQPDGGVSAENAVSMLETAMKEGSNFVVWTFERGSGEKFLATILTTRMELDGQVVLQATVRDETQMKRLEAVMGQADRLASMGMLAAGVAHEINNPLVYVLYNIESLANDLPKVVAAARRCSSALRRQLGDAAFADSAGDDVGMLHETMLEEVVDRAREALAGTRRIRTIAKALGTFSRVERAERSAVDVNYAIECAITMAFNEIKYRAKLVKDLGRVPAVWGSDGKLSQVFLNLLINASHAIDEGDPANNRVSIRTWADGDSAFAEITDTGKGIPTEHLPRIFEPFFTTKPMGIGSGLGLAICRNIVVDFGGDICCESELGRGTRFVVRLPLHTGTGTAVTSAFAETRSVPGTRGRILILDDEELILKTIQQLLAPDHEVIVAMSGQAGRAILEHDQAFDVILCDMMMPEMTGMALHEWLAMRHPELAAKVVFLSGGAFTPKVAVYLASVANLRLDKPIDAADLQRLVNRLVIQAKRLVSGGNGASPRRWTSPIL